MKLLCQKSSRIRRHLQVILTVIQSIEQISKAVQNQLSAILPSMIQEMSKLTPRTEGAHMLAQTPRLAAGSTQGLRKRPSASRLAAGSTQGLNEQTEQVSDENEDVQEINAEEFEPPAKKVNLSESTEFSDLNEDSPGRWEASEELSSLLNVFFIDTTLSTCERKQITKEFPRPNIEAVYTPVLDNYLSSLIAGAKGVDKEPKRLQDQILDVVGPLSMVFEHVSGWQSSQDSAETITVPSNNINGLYACLTKALCLLGSINNQLTVQRRKQILDKLNPKLNSLATEPFPDAGKMLFGESFEEKIKQRMKQLGLFQQQLQRNQQISFFAEGSSYRPWRGGQERGRWNYQARGRYSFRTRGRGRGRFPNPQFQTSQAQQSQQ